MNVKRRAWILFLSVLICCSATGRAAPIEGSIHADIVLHSATCSVDEDGDTFVDEDPPNGMDDDGDALVDEDSCSKIDLSVFKFETDVVLSLTISGLQITSTSVLTFKGLEYQAFTVVATVGALSIKDTLVFAPSITEIEFVRTSSALHLRYCVRASAPGSVSPPFRACPLPHSRLYWLLEDVGFYHPAVANLILAQIFDAGGMLDAELTLRKKLVDLTLNIGGMTVSTRALFANLGTATAPDFRMGLILALEGQTVSGITVRSETWIGAHQGLECFAECKPLERLYGGVVVEDFSPHEEKLFVRNLNFAGMNFAIRAEFDFFDEPGAPCAGHVLCFVEINTFARVSPLNLDIANTLRLGPGLQERFDSLTATVKLGDMTATAMFYFYPSIGKFGAQVAQVIGSFDPPGFSLTSDVRFCTGEAILTPQLCTRGVLKHTLSGAATVGDMTLDMKLIFYGGFMKDFYQLWLDAVWKLGGSVEITSSVVMSAEFLSALAFSLKVRF